MARDCMSQVLSCVLVVIVHVSRLCQTAELTDPNHSPRRIVRIIPLESIPVVSLSPIQRNYIPVSPPNTAIAELLHDPSHLSEVIAQSALPVNLLSPSLREYLSPRVSERRSSPRVAIYRLQPNIIGSASGTGQSLATTTGRATGTVSAAALASSNGRHWGYDDYSADTLGPSRWYREFPTCGGRLQSPIDIRGPTITYAPIPPLNVYNRNGSRGTKVVITNRGVFVSIKCVDENVLMNGANLPGTFILSNIHFHWGRTNGIGSEHRLFGKAFPVEMHLVSYNRKYANLMDAVNRPDGIHAIAIFFEMSRFANSGLNFCIDSLSNVIQPGSQVNGGVLDVSSFLPDPRTPVYRYRGSTTTPPCYENVIWTAYSTPQSISPEQLNAFRQLSLDVVLNPSNGGSVRPLQSLDSRPIYTNNPYIG